MMRCLDWLTLLCVGLLLGFWQVKAYAAEGDIEYRFERMLPQLEQPWYFNSPKGIAIAPDGSVWVADTDNHRIQHFKADGTFIAQFGSQGSEAGQFQFPKGISVAADGSVWVADSANDRFQHFKADGSLIAELGSSGSKVGQFNTPMGISVAPDGSVWLADSSNDRLQHFKADGSLIAELGSDGLLAEQFYRPLGISVAVDGSVWVADTYNHRIQHLKADGSLLGQFGRESGERAEAGTFLRPKGISAAPDGSVWVADTDNHRIQHLKADGTVINVFGNKDFKRGQFYSPSDISVAHDGSVWVADTDNDRLLHLKADGSLIAQFGSQSSKVGQFLAPNDISVAVDGSVWVTDSGNDRLQHLKADGTFIAQFPNFGSKAGPFNFPSGVSVAPDGSVWVVDTDNHRIQHLGADGSFIGQFGGEGYKAGQFMYPIGIDVAADNSIWVTDRDNHRFQHFKADGTFIGQFGSRGSKVGQFEYPTSISISVDGSLWVVDTNNHRLQHFNADGRFIAQFGSKGSKVEQFNYPSCISVAADGSVWVADTFNNRLQHLKADGTFIRQLGGEGSNAGQFSVPSGITVTADGSVWVADTGNSRLQKFVPRKKSLSAHPYKAIVLAGGGPTLGNRSNYLWEGTERITQKAYRGLSLQGFKVHEEILFLTAGSTQFDLDANNHFDDLLPATKASLRNTITEWASDAKDVLIYLADHGGPDKFQINATEILTGTELADWVTQLEKIIPGKVSIVFESCNAASFFNKLANLQRPRNLFASTQADQPAVLANNGSNSFSYYFWSEVTSGAKLKEAFTLAKQDASSIEVNGQRQNAQADADGDAESTAQDLTALGDYCLGNCNFKPAALPPTIEAITPNTQTLTGAQTLDLKINVQHLQDLIDVWALVQRPDDLSIDPNQPLDFEKIPLRCDQNDQCTGRYNRFDTQGQYRLSFYAQDKNYEISSPEVLLVTQTQGKSVSPAVYDAKQTTLYLRDVMVGGKHYQAVLQLENGQFQLLSYSPAFNTYSPAANFDSGTHLLTIPLAQAFGQQYQAVLQNNGNALFSLQSATVKQ